MNLKTYVAKKWFIPDGYGIKCISKPSALDKWQALPPHYPSLVMFTNKYYTERQINPVVFL
jgi:hypothetical protein